MRIYPGEHIDVANSEPIELELQVDAAPASVTVTCDGTETVIELDDGAFTLPTYDAPTSLSIGWTGCPAPVTCDVIDRFYFPADALIWYDGGRDGFERMDERERFMARQAATEVFEQNAKRSFVARRGSTVDYGHGELVPLAHDLRTIETDGYAIASGSTARRTRCMDFPQTVEFTYGAGYVPAEVSNAVLTLAAYILRPSNRPIGATGESSDAGYIHFTTAGRDGATAIPEVNAAIQQFGAGDRLLW